MNVPKELREVLVTDRQVLCLDRKEQIEKCRFCAHSVSFLVNGVTIQSPAREFCVLSRGKSAPSRELDLSQVKVVFCDDFTKEGFRSIMNIIG
jgi:hypothetical protein